MAADGKVVWHTRCDVRLAVGEAHEKAEIPRKEMASSLNSSLGSIVSAASACDTSKRVEIIFPGQGFSALTIDSKTLMENVDADINATDKVLSRGAKGNLKPGSKHNSTKHTRRTTIERVCAQYRMLVCTSQENAKRADVRLTFIELSVFGAR